ncbi:MULTISPECIES: alginate export family protein [Sphingomonas]|uniref:alginate export family protein n=1 Tax=Sphingomonas TaxID=13687 RepID=UPI0020BEBF51|nr:alginate export family protein [Sphingomonas faeni]MCK8455149.1 alginate export family protein [Sphingomonas faeni]
MKIDTLYGARRFELGPTELFGAVDRSNLVSLGVGVKASPTKRLSLMSDYWLFRLASAFDRFSNSDVQDEAGRAGRRAGQQVQAQLEYDLFPQSSRWTSALRDCSRGASSATRRVHRHASMMSSF